MVAASKTILFALLAVSAQALNHHRASGHHHHARAVGAFHDSHAAHHAIREMGTAESDAIKKRMTANATGNSKLTKRHDENKNRLKKRAKRCKPKNISAANVSSDPSNNDGGNDNKDNNNNNNDNNNNDNKPTATEKPKPKPTVKKPAKNDGGNGGGGGGGGGSGTTYTGDGTFYSTGLNACGTVDHDSDFIAAISYKLWDNYPGFNGNSNDHPLCQKKASVTYQGKHVTVRITDRCAGCEIEGSLDFSPSAFDVFASPDIGRIHGLTWQLDD